MIYLTEPQPPAISEDAPVLCVCGWLPSSGKVLKSFITSWGVDSKNKYHNKPQNHITRDNSTMKH